MLAIFFVALMSYVGLSMRVPVTTMFTFSWAMLFAIFWVFDVRMMVPLIVMGIIFVGIQLVNSLYKGPKDATQ